MNYRTNLWKHALYTSKRSRKVETEASYLNCVRVSKRSCLKEGSVEFPQVQIIAAKSDNSTHRYLEDIFREINSGYGFLQRSLFCSLRNFTVTAVQFSKIYPTFFA